MTHESLDIKSMYLPELKDFLVSLGEPAFRAGQVFGWMHAKLAKSPDDMANIPKSLREKLNADYRTLTAITVQESSDGSTKKYLFGLYDGNAIESVLMKYKHGNSVCISSQVGCRMGCRFCASTIDGLVRNLSASEMLEQIYEITRLTGERVDNVVIMGCGEPMDNYDNLIRFIKLISAPEGLNLSRRSITVSTCGLIPGIYALAKENLPVTLALSLHAHNDEMRKKIMPVANKYSIDELLKACRSYFDETGRRVSFEYSLIDGENDSEEDAYALAKLLKGMGAHVNLIPVNPVKEREYARSKVKNVLTFQQTLEKCGINATIRREMGSDIDAACGQLRRNYKDKVDRK